MSFFCYCGADTTVVDSRYQPRGRYGAFIRRRRLCERGHRFTSIEMPSSMVKTVMEQTDVLDDARELLMSLARRLPKPLSKSALLFGPEARRGQARPAADGMLIASRLRHCDQCGREHESSRKHGRFCSLACKRAFERMRATAIEGEVRVVDEPA